MNNLTMDGNFLQFYQYFFVVALFLIAVISAVLIAGLMKARKDGKEQLDLAREQVQILKDCRKSLNEIKEKLVRKGDEIDSE